MTVKFTWLGTHLEIFNLHFKLISAILILDLFKPLTRLAEVFLGVKLLSFFLNDDSVNICQTKFTGNFSLFYQNLFFEFVKIRMTIDFNISWEFSGIYSKNLAFLNIAAKIISNIIVVLAKLSCVLRIKPWIRLILISFLLILTILFTLWTITEQFI